MNEQALIKKLNCCTDWHIEEILRQHQAGHNILEDITVLFSNPEKIPFIFSNQTILKELGVYESNLLWAWLHGHTGSIALKTATRMFQSADRKKLLACGDPLPTETLNEGGKYDLYRGVGFGNRRNGFSWTNDCAVAARFVRKFERGCIMTTRVEPKDILCYTNARQEKEFLIYPPADTWLRSKYTRRTNG
jgi:hypothetical protein